MKKRKNLMFIGVIIILTLVIVLYFMFKGSSLSGESDTVKQLYTYLGSNDLQVCAGLVNYGDKEITVDDISNDMKICMAYSLVDSNDVVEVKIDKSKKNNTCSVKDGVVFATDNYEDDICTVTKVDEILINNKYKEMYGKDIENSEKFQYDNSTICYYVEDEGYYCGLSETYTATIGAEPHTYRTIKKVVEGKDELVIYDYFLRVINDECYENYTTDTKNDKCTKKYNGNVKYNFLKKYGTEYKHTFKKAGESYYWVSSVPVK